MEFSVVIPLTCNVKGFPDRPLVDLNGKPLMQYLIENAQNSGADHVLVPTEDERIAEVARSLGAYVVQVEEEVHTDQERALNAVLGLGLGGDDLVVVLDGGEPLITSELIRQLPEAMIEHDNIKMVSMCESIQDANDLYNPNIVKVVLDRRRYARYFSRAPIPWEQDHFVFGQVEKEMDGIHYRQLGIYGYRIQFLEEYVAMAPCPEEKMEQLEQLRVLWHGGRIYMCPAKKNVSHRVDSMEDIALIEALFKKT